MVPLMAGTNPFFTETLLNVLKCNPQLVRQISVHQQPRPSAFPPINHVANQL